MFMEIENKRGKTRVEMSSSKLKDLILDDLVYGLSSPKIRLSAISDGFARDLIHKVSSVQNNVGRKKAVWGWIFRNETPIPWNSRDLKDVNEFLAKDFREGDWQKPLQDEIGGLIRKCGYRTEDLPREEKVKDFYVRLKTAEIVSKLDERQKGILVKTLELVNKKSYLV